MASFNQNIAFSGLSTVSMIAPSAGPYCLDGKISLPTITNGGGASACVATVNQNGSPIYTGIAGAEGFKVDMLCAANDTIALVLSSAAAADAPANVIKGVLAFAQGV